MKWLKRLSLLMLAIVTVFTISYSSIEETEAATQRKFVVSIGNEARNHYGKTKILPSVITSMASLESGYGRSKLAKKAHNLFGYKYVKGCKKNAKKFGVTITGYVKSRGSKWVKFKSNKDSVKYLMYIFSKGRYKSIKNKTNPSKVIDILIKKGYCRDKGYKKKLLKILKKYKLTSYDKKIVKNSKPTEVDTTINQIKENIETVTETKEVIDTVKETEEVQETEIQEEV